MFRISFLSALMLSLPMVAHAEGLGGLSVDSFPGQPCSDGWSGCRVDGVAVTPEMVRDADSRPHPADMRLGFFDLKPLPGLSPFVELSSYSETATPPPVELDEVAQEVAMASTETASNASGSSNSSASSGTTTSANSSTATSAATSSAGDAYGPSSQANASTDGNSATAPANAEFQDVQGDASSVESAQGSSTVSNGGQPEAVVEAVAVDAGSSSVSGADMGASVATNTAQEDAGTRDELESGSSEGREADDGQAAAVASGSAPVGCGDLIVLQAPAMVGQLGVERRQCLEGRIAAGGSTQTTLDKISRVLIIDAEARGEKSDWERLVSRHLNDISRSDPDLCMHYAIHLSRTGRYASVIKWSDYALQNKQKWSANTYVQKVNALYKLRAKGANKLWQAANEELVRERNAANESEEERTRGNAMNFAKEWLDYARASGQSSADALALCVSAAGHQEFCK